MAGAQLYVTGPVDVYVGFASGGTTPVTPYYLGTGERAPRIHIDDAWKPVFNDLKGSAKAFDKLYLGESATIAVNLGRWDETIYTKLAAQPIYNNTRGKNVIGDMGTLAFFEMTAVCVWLKFPYQAYLPYTSMPPGYRFPGAVLASTDFDPIGTEARVIPLVFEADSVYDTTTGEFLLYDQSMVGLPPRT